MKDTSLGDEQGVLELMGIQVNQVYQDLQDNQDCKVSQE
jgi:hypothetical protein